MGNILLVLILLAMTAPAGAQTCGDRHTPVSAVQGGGTKTPVAGEWLTVEGVITLDLRMPGGFEGFYLQQVRSEHDKDPTTSEGLFVHTRATGGRPGDRVRVRGKAAEYYGLTSLSGADSVTVCSSPGLPEPHRLDARDLAGATHGREALEGMLVHISSSLVVTDTWNLARYGELVLAPSLQWMPTQRHAPGRATAQLLGQQERAKLILDDGRRQRQPRPVPWPPDGLGPDNPVRVGDQVGPLTGIMDYRFGNWRLQPATMPELGPASSRRPPPGRHQRTNLRVVSLNLGNLFNGDGQGNGFPTPRGARTRADYEGQLQRLVAQVRATDPDILAVSELENDGYHDHSAIAQLASALGDHWRFVTGNTDTHNDEIRNALLYRSDRVRPEGTAILIDTATFRRWHRPPVAQTFGLTSGSGETVTVVTVHLKSKSCRNAPAPQQDTGDGQSCFAGARAEAARVLAQWKPPDAERDSPLLLVGDLNAYAMEDPLRILADSGYTDLIRHFHGTGNLTFRFHGRQGTLDYHLANEAALDRVLASHIWSVNAEEPRVWAYNADNGIAVPPGYPWRASDHNPVITDLRLRQP